MERQDVVCICVCVGLCVFGGRYFFPLFALKGI